MSFQGFYDPNVFVNGSYGTYPVPAIGSKYQPGYYWTFSVGGTFDGTPVSAGDRTYVEGRARQYGEANYGSDLYGDPAGSDWPVYVTSWVLWFADQFPWFQNPPLSGGCPFLPGWNIHVELLQDNRTVPDDGNFEWVDYSDFTVEVTWSRGESDGRQVLPVDRLRVVMVDRDGALFPMWPVATSGNLGPGDRMRVGMSDGTVYYPLCTGRIDRVEDIHDVQPRLVALSAYGQMMDLAVPLEDWQRGPETAAARGDAIEAAIDWDWSEFSYESSPGYDLAADPSVRAVSAREELDRTAVSTGWSMRSDKRGSIQFVDAPYSGTGGILVADCTGQTGIASPVITYSNDLGELLNSSTIATDWRTLTVDAAWNYTTPPAPGTLVAGDCEQADSTPGNMTFHVFDADLTDRTTAFQQLQPGDIVLKEGYQWTIVSVTDNNPTPTFTLGVVAAVQNGSDGRFGFRLSQNQYQLVTTAAESVARFGERSGTQGYPISGVATLNLADMQTIASTFLARYDQVVTRVDQVAVDSLLDDRWIQTVADLELGEFIQVTRYGLPYQLTLQGIVSGYTITITPDSRAELRSRITGTIEVTGSTKTTLEAEQRQTAGGVDRQTATDGIDRLTGWGNLI